MGSKRKPRKKHGPTAPRPELVARILVDAETFTDAISARRNKVSERTVRNYRSRYEDHPAIAELCRALRERIATGWVDKVRTSLDVALDAVVEKLIDPESTLRDRTAALRELRETTHAHELLNDDAGVDHQRRDPPAPEREGAAGEGATQGRGSTPRGGRGEGEDAED